MRTINQFPKRTDFYAALIRALNGLYEGVAFRFRYYGATTSQEAAASSAVFVEPGAWKIERLSRGSSVKICRDRRRRWRGRLKRRRSSSTR